eukprot:188698-Karenia_brevis.AAC.1
MSEKQNSEMLSSIQKCTADILQHTEKIVDSKVAPVFATLDDHRDKLEYWRQQHDELVSRVALLEK